MAVNKKLYIIACCLFAASCCIAAWHALSVLKFPAIPSWSPHVVAPREWSGYETQDIAWDVAVFKKDQVEHPVRLGPLAQRFRLAGTFLAVSDSRQSRQAVIDILAGGLQKMASEGEMLDSTVQVKSIFRDRVILREGGQEEEIWLSFSDAGKAMAYRPDKPHDAADTTLLRFGKRVGEKRWVLSRDAVLEYYQELLDDTERLANVFASMQPVYEGDAIQGYVLDIQGEGEFFNAFGLQQDDIVRSVNSMPMTSRLRAEYFIREFVADRANAFVFEIERRGIPERLVYMVR